MVRMCDLDALRADVEALNIIMIGCRAGKGALKECLMQYRDAVLKKIDEQPTIFPVTQEWISVNDRLPELNKRVFAHVVDMAKGKRLLLVGGYDGKFWFVQTAVTTLIFDTMYKVTHWMPLPEPPERMK